MPGEPRTAAELREIVRERLHALETIKEDGATIAVPEPQWHAPDGDGCNWTMEYFGGDSTGYGDAIAAVVGKTRREFMLRT